MAFFPELAGVTDHAARAEARWDQGAWQARVALSPQRTEGPTRLGAVLVGRERFLDHYRFEPEDLAEIFRLAQADGAECVVTTEKDAVRISEGMALPLPLYYLRLEIEILHGAADFDEAVARICFPRGAGPR